MDKARPKPGIGDVLLALVLLVMGFLFWNWGLLIHEGGGLGGFLFFLTNAVCAYAYLRWRGVRQNALSRIAFAVVILGALPFPLYDQRDISLLNCLFEVNACLLWLGLSCKTMIGEKLSGFLPVDGARQWFIVPFTNFVKIFSNIWFVLRGKDHAPEATPGAMPGAAQGAMPGAAPAPAPAAVESAPKFDAQTGKPLAPAEAAPARNSRTKSILILLAGLLVSIPIIILIITLLANSDDGFAEFVTHLKDLFDFGKIREYALQFFFGIPVACYIFGAIFGNAVKNHSFPIPIEKADRALGSAHVLPRMALYAPLVLLVVIYITYFVTMASYLFSAFGGELPTDYIYSQYARRGFFELCGVVTINLGLLGFTYLLARRKVREYPPLLRVLTGIISLCTCLLILTAMSKMGLYIDAYGLSRLRVYTLWFMAMLLLVFLVLLVWHIKPFKSGRILVVIPLVCSLVLFLTNTDGIIARYNVERYLTGQTEKIDSNMLAYLSDAVVPSLLELKEKAPDESVRKDAADAIELHFEGFRWMLYDEESEKAFYNWNIQSLRASGMTVVDPERPE